MAEKRKAPNDTFLLMPNKKRLTEKGDVIYIFTKN